MPACHHSRLRTIFRSPAPPGRQKAGAFTLIELLVVLAIVLILGALVLPALSLARTKEKQAACVNNLKQLAAGWQMYAADNEGRLVANQPYQKTNCWAGGLMNLPRLATNDFFVREGQLFPYIRATSLYRCPADTSHAHATPRVRSYSMNGWMGSRYMDAATVPAYRTFVKETELAASPTTCWVIADEHELTIDDSFFLVTMDDSQPFASFPATRHQRGFSLSFADGRVEIYRLRDPRTQINAATAGTLSAQNTDWTRLKQITTASWNF